MPELDVPYVGQWGVYANRYRTDCGVASVAMCLEYFCLRGNLTVDALATETPLSQQDNGLSVQSLATLAGRHGLKGQALRGVGLDALRREIDAGRPVIPLVDYSLINGRLDQGYTGGHFFVVVGYDETHFVVNDPDYWAPYTERGHDVYIPVAELDRAMNASGSQALVMENPMTIGAQIGSLIGEAENKLSDAKALAAQIDTNPPPIPGTTMWTTSALNYRTEPSTAGGAATVKGTLRQGDQIQVEDVPTAPGWKRIVYGPFTGYYVNAAFLSPDPT